jgi:hypothetical protein
MLSRQGDSSCLTVYRIVVSYRDQINVSIFGFLENLFNREIAVRAGLGMDVQIYLHF